MNVPFPNDFGVNSEPFRIMVDHAHHGDRRAAMAVGQCYILGEVTPCRSWYTRHFYPNMIAHGLDNNMVNALINNIYAEQNLFLGNGAYNHNQVQEG